MMDNYEEAASPQFRSASAPHVAAVSLSYHKEELSTMQRKIMVNLRGILFAIGLKK